MKFIVGNREFDNYDDAKRYEAKRDYLFNNLRIYECQVYIRGITVFFVVNAKGNHEKYVFLKARAKYGDPVVVSDDRELLYRWRLTECQGDKFSRLVSYLLGELENANYPVYIIDMINDEFTSDLKDTAVPFDDYLYKFRESVLCQDSKLEHLALYDDSAKSLVTKSDIESYVSHNLESVEGFVDDLGILDTVRLVDTLDKDISTYIINYINYNK